MAKALNSTSFVVTNILSMKYIIIIFVFLVTACSPTSTYAPSEQIQDVKEAIIADHTAFVTRDLQKLSTMYVTDEETIGVFDLGNVVGAVVYAEGYDAIIGTYQAYFSDPTATVFPPPTLSEWHIEVKGAIAIANYKQRITDFRVNDMEHDNGISYWMRVMKLSDGRWKTYKVMVTVAYIEAIPPVRCNY